jgi:uncharacterized protein (TIGR01777 family)
MKKEKTVLVAGGTGMIGKCLVPMLQAKGYEVRILSRSRGAGTYYWNPMEGSLDMDALHGVDYVINLAGSGIVDRRWSLARKRELTQSRVRSAAVLLEGFRELGTRPEVYISSSAIGIYGDSGEEWVMESKGGDGGDFMVQCCSAWELAAREFELSGSRVVILRTGLVLDSTSGALAEIIRPLKFRLAVYFADGCSWYSWIHREDMARMIVWSLEEIFMRGVYNSVAPNPVRNRDLVRIATKQLGKRMLWVSVPAFALRLIMGEMSAVILNSNRVSAEKVTASGFSFQFPTIDTALKDLMN